MRRPPVLWSLGLTLWGVGALASLASAQSVDAARLYNRGIDYYNKGNTVQAIKLFEQSAQADPNYPDAFYNLGSLYYQSKQYDKAAEAFRKTVQLKADDNLARYHWALATEKQQKYGDAIWILKKIPPDDRNYAKAQNLMASWRPKADAQRRAEQDSDVTNGRISPDRGEDRWQPKPIRKSQDALLDGDMQRGEKGKAVGRRGVETYARGFFGPTGMAMDYRGDLYVANYSRNLIYKVSPQGQKAVVLQDGGLHGPIGLALNDRTGDLYVANYLDNNVLRINADGQVGVIASGLNKPYSLLLDGVNNTLYVAEQETNVVSRISLTP